MKPTRRLAAIMFTDMVGFSSLTYRDEMLSKELVFEKRKIVRQYIDSFGGVENQTTGDGFLIEFSSAVDAVQCAIAIQTNLYERSKHLGLDRKIQIRIGIHVGDILVEGSQLIGSGVNIAARIEPLANPGGICITRQVYDQVVEKLSDVVFKKQGHRKLKNIASGAEIYQVAMPWQRHEAKSLNVSKIIQRNNEFNPFTLSGSTISALFTVSLLLLLTVLFRTQVGGQGSSSRGPAGLESAQRVDLANEWSYSLDKTARSKDSRSTPLANEADWKAFDSEAYGKYANTIQGSYWLKKEFKITNEFQQPAIVLGLIPDRHRAFLNNNFIGGSDHLSDVAMYAFDSKILNHGKNTLIIQAESRPTLKPGLTILPKVGAFLSEFSEVRESVIKNQILFHLLRNVYFILSLVIFLSCFALALFQRENKTYFYSSFYLLLGSIHLIYYTPWVSETFDFELVKFLKLFSVIMSSLVLCSGFLKINKRHQDELVNNCLAIIIGASATLSLLFLHHNPSDFMEIYNSFLIAAAGYSMIWPIYALIRLAPSLRDFRNLILSFSGVYLVFGFLGAIPCISSLANNLLPTTIDDALKDISVTLPFAFSIFAIAIGTKEHIQKSRNVAKDIRRDELILELVRIVRNSTDSLESIQLFQKKMSEFVSATKSRIYIFEDQNLNDNLKLVFAIDKTHCSLQFTHDLDSHLGPIGYVVKNSSPLLIKDIQKDIRFKTTEKTSPKYRTGSCMIFPLQANSKLLGVLTFADKKNDEAFTQSNFKAILELSAVLGLLIDNRQMREIIATQSLAS